MMYSRRIAQPSDYSQILSLISDGKNQMAIAGITQWNESYPNKTIIKQDIDKQQLCIYGKNYEAIVTLSIRDKTGVIQRLVVNSNYKGNGIAHYILSDIIYQEKRNNILEQLKMCTNHSNIPIRNLLKDLNFHPCRIYKEKDRKQFGDFIEYSYPLSYRE